MAADTETTTIADGHPGARDAPSAARSAPTPPLSRTLAEGDGADAYGPWGAKVEDAPGPGDAIGRFRVLEQIGAGGMGVVFAAYDDRLDRKVAVKLVHASADDGARLRGQSRLLEEARAMAQLDHPNVITVFETGTHRDGVFVAMEFIRGQTLRAWLRQELALERVLDAFVQAGRGLAAAHAAGLVHRDFKPDNAMIDERGRVRVLDFGLAIAAEPETAASVQARPASEDLPLDDVASRAAGFAGTPSYMAPEVFHGQRANAASDQFSFCVALWEGLFGERPFHGDSLLTLASAVASGEVSAPGDARGPRGRVPGWLRDTLLRGLSPQPERRWPSLRALVEALEAGDPRLRLRRRGMVVGLGIGLLTTIGGFEWKAAQRMNERIAACDAEGDALGWTAARATALHEGLVATQARDARAIADEAVATLGSFAETWKTARTEACMDLQVDPGSDRALALASIDCLEQRRATFDATLQTFAEIDAPLMSRVQTTLGGFDQLDACTDPKQLALMPARPEDPQVSSEVRDLELTLARTLVNEHVGSYEEGLRTSKAALEAAEATGYTPTIAHARYRVAVFLEKLGRYEEAVDTWARTFREAATSGYERLAADAAAALAFCEGYRLARYDTGVRWAELAGVYGARIGDTDGLREGRRLDVLAVLQEMRGELELAAQHHERSLALRRAAVGPRHHSIAYGLVNYSYVLEKRGEPEGARDMLAEALGIFREHYGDENPTTAQVVHALARAEQGLGELDRAEALYDEAERTWQATLPPDHPNFAGLHEARGDLERERGQLGRAAEEYAKGLELRSATLPPEHPDLARTRLTLVELELDRGRLEAAEALLEVLASGPAAPALEDSELAGRLELGRARLADARGQTERVRAYVERALQKFEGIKDDDARAKWEQRAQALPSAEGASPAARPAR